MRKQRVARHLLTFFCLLGLTSLLAIGCAETIDDTADPVEPDNGTITQGARLQPTFEFDDLTDVVAVDVIIYPQECGTDHRLVGGDGLLVDPIPFGPIPITANDTGAVFNLEDYDARDAAAPGSHHLAVDAFVVKLASGCYSATFRPLKDAHNDSDDCEPSATPQFSVMAGMMTDVDHRYTINQCKLIGPGGANLTTWFNFNPVVHWTKFSTSRFAFGENKHVNRCELVTACTQIKEENKDPILQPIYRLLDDEGNDVTDTVLRDGIGHLSSSVDAQAPKITEFCAQFTFKEDAPSDRYHLEVTVLDALPNLYDGNKALMSFESALAKQKQVLEKLDAKNGTTLALDLNTESRGVFKTPILVSNKVVQACPCLKKAGNNNVKNAYKHALTEVIDNNGSFIEWNGTIPTHVQGQPLCNETISVSAYDTSMTTRANGRPCSEQKYYDGQQMTVAPGAKIGPHEGPLNRLRTAIPAVCDYQWDIYCGPILEVLTNGCHGNLFLEGKVIECQP